MLKKDNAWPSVNKSTERHPHVPYNSPPLFPTFVASCSLQYYLSPQVGVGMRRKLRSKFSCSERGKLYRSYRVTSNVINASKNRSQGAKQSLMDITYKACRERELSFTRHTLNLHRQLNTVQLRNKRKNVTIK